MRRILITIILIVVTMIQVVAQSTINDVIHSVEANNTMLKALQKRMEAAQMNNKTGIYLANPEVEFNYLFGNPTVIGNRTDISVTQSFDFPTAYVYEKQLADMKNDQLALEYQHQKRQILLQTKQVLVELTYCNALVSEYQKRMDDAEQIAKSYQIKMEHGECSQLELNKANLNLLNVQSDLKQEQVKREELLSQLAVLNGGTLIDFMQSDYGDAELPVDFEAWYQQAEENNPMLQWLKQEVEINQKEIQLSKAKQLPSMQAGYMSEKVVGEQFQGITFGVSIPLWENKNRVKALKLNVEAAESSQTDEQLRFYESLKALHTKSISLQASLTNYEKQFKQFSNAALLHKALESGEISLIEYLYETSLTYEGIDRILELKKEMESTLIELNQYQ